MLPLNTLDTATGLITALLFKDKCLQKADSQCAGLHREITDLTNQVNALINRSCVVSSAYEGMFYYIEKRFKYRFEQYEERLSKKLLLQHPTYIELSNRKPGTDEELVAAQDKVLQALEDHLRKMKDLMNQIQTVIETLN